MVDQNDVQLEPEEKIEVAAADDPVKVEKSSDANEISADEGITQLKKQLEDEKKARDDAERRAYHAQQQAQEAQRQQRVNTRDQFIDTQHQLLTQRLTVLGRGTGKDSGPRDCAGGMCRR